MSELDGAGGGAPPRNCHAGPRGAAAKRPQTGIIAGVLLRHRLVIVELSAVRVLLNLFFLSSSICFGLLIDKVFIHQSRSSLVIILVALVALAAVEALLSAHAEETARILRTLVQGELIGAVTDRWCRARPGDEGRGPGPTFEASSTATWQIGELALDSAYKLSSAILSLVAILLVLFLINPRLAATVAVLYLLYLVVHATTRPARRRLAAAADRSRQAAAEAVSRYLKLIERSPSSRLLVQAPVMLAVSSTRIDEDVSAALAARVRFDGLDLLLRRLIGIVVLAVGSLEMLDGQLTVGFLIAFIVMQRRLDQLVEGVAPYWSRWAFARSLRRDMAAQGSAQLLAPLPPPSSTAAGRLHFEIALSPPAPGSESGEPGGASVAIRPGDRIGLLGQRASGPSGLLRALCGLDPDPAHSVRVNGVSADQVCPETFAAHIRFVAANQPVLGRTLREHFLLLAPGASDGQIAGACDQFGAGPILEEIPGGLDAPVEDFGSGLPLGVRQHLAIAAAFLARPDVLILDRALDALGEREQARLLAQLAESDWRPTIIAALGRSTASGLFDRVLLVDHCGAVRGVAAKPMQGLGLPGSAPAAVVADAASCPMPRIASTARVSP